VDYCLKVHDHVVFTALIMDCIGHIKETSSAYWVHSRITEFSVNVSYLASS